MIVIFMSAYSVLYMLRDGLIGGSKTVGLALTMILVCASFTLIMIPELIIVSDQFGSRMNTVFKLYYQAWILLSISFGTAAYYIGYLLIKSNGVQKLIAASFGCVLVVLLSICLYYAPAAAFTKVDTSDIKSLDGLDYIKNKNPDELAAIGENVYLGVGGCTACHGLGTRAPDLLGVAGTVCTTRDPELTCKEYLYESLVDPLAMIVEGFQPIMLDQSRTLGQPELWTLVAYLESQGGEITVTADDISGALAAAEAAEAQGALEPETMGVEEPVAEPEPIPA